MNSELLDLFCAQSQDYALLLLNKQGRIVQWLGGASRIFGYAEHEVRYQTTDFMFIEGDRVNHAAARELDVAREQSRHEDERWYLCKDEKLVWMQGVTIALHDEHGQLAGFAKVMRDRTDARLQGDRIQTKNQALVENDGRKNLFIGTLAHELRNVIGPLNNATQLIKLSSKNSDFEYPLNLITRQVKFIETLVDDLLEVTSINFGKIKLKLAPVELTNIVNEAIETCSEPLKESGHRIAVSAPQPITVEADPIRLQEVFVNLISNSLKYSEPHSTIHVKCNTVNSHAIVSVIDDGRGIAPDFLPHIFEKFTQGENRKSAEGGLGLGLAIVKSLVELHKGTVQAKSDGIGKGCEFTVTLPLAASASLTGEFTRSAAG